MQTYEKLLLSQTKRAPKYNDMDTWELVESLRKVAGRQGLCRDGLDVEQNAEMEAALEDYVVTPDNFLKMLRIALLARAGIPVVLMGETGCGKTSLIQALALILGADFRVQNFHAGVSVARVEGFIIDCVAQADMYPGKEIWAFLDEINTSEHLGALTEIICCHELFGKRLPSNLVILAACNPYRRKLQSSSATSAALAVVTNRKRRFANLVYTVNMLPETVLQYVYDFGKLPATEEQQYTKLMIKNLIKDNDMQRRIKFHRCHKEWDDDKNDYGYALRGSEWRKLFMTPEEESGFVNATVELITASQDFI